MTAPRTLLLDGDVLAFRASASAQKVEVDGFGVMRPFAYKVEAEAGLDNLVLGLMDGLQATHALIVLSDPQANWRMEVMKEYKHNRDYTIVNRPLLLAHAKDYLRAQYAAFHYTGLEADDTLGILATEPWEAEAGERVVVGNDKDFKQIPGLHHTLGDRDGSGKMLLHAVTTIDADRFHMQQTLSGDRVDGYSGCPGLGPERAARLVATPVILKPSKGVVTRGPRKGQSVTKWVSEPTADLWACVVTHYQAEGLPESEALKTARVARILRDGEYNRQTGAVKLWTPHAA